MGRRKGERKGGRRGRMEGRKKGGREEGGREERMGRKGRNFRRARTKERNKLDILGKK